MKHDWWAAGVILFQLCQRGRFPFDGHNLAKLTLNIIDPLIKAPLLGENIPKEIRKICKGLLEKDENKRIGYEQIIKSEIIMKEIKMFFLDFHYQPGLLLKLASVDPNLTVFLHSNWQAFMFTSKDFINYNLKNRFFVVFRKPICTFEKLGPYNFLRLLNTDDDNGPFYFKDLYEHNYYGQLYSG